MTTTPAASSVTARFSSKATLFAYLLILLSAGWSGARLNQTVFFDDEAQISFIARNLLHTGTWTQWDGRNLAALSNGDSFERNLPLLDGVLVAGSFGLFGDSTWAARLPFWLLGVLSLFVFWRLLQRLTVNTTLQVYCFACMAFSVNFLLFITCARYYALVLFFGLLIYHNLVCYLQNRRRYHVWLMACFAVLMFISSGLCAAAFLIASAALMLIFYRRQLKARDYLNFTPGIVLFLLIAGAYTLKNRLWAFQPSRIQEVWYEKKLTLLWWNFRDLNTASLLPWIVAAGLIYFLIRSRKDEQTSEVRGLILQWATLIAVYACVIAALSPQTIKHTDTADIRYLVTLIPFCAAMSGAWLWSLSRYSHFLAAPCLALLICTTALTWTPGNWRMRLLLPAYIREISQPYPTSSELVMQFLQQNAAQDDIVYADPEFFNYTLMFYMSDKIRVGCVYDSTTPIPRETLKAFNAPLLREENFPNWYIAYGFGKDDVDKLNLFSRKHRQDGKWISYPYRVAMKIPIYWFDTQRPELNWHSFGPAAPQNDTEGVTIFKRENARLEKPEE